MATPLASTLRPSVAVSPSPTSQTSESRSAVSYTPTPSATIALSPTATATPWPSPTATPTPWALSGVVRDAESGLPLPNVKVTYGYLETRTDARGVYAFHRPLDLLSPVRARLAGYEEQVALWKGEATLDIHLSPRRTRVLVLSRASSQPLPGAILAAPGRRLQADAQGIVRVSFLEPGDELRVSLEGYLDETLIYRGEAELVVSLVPRRLHGLVLDGLRQEPVSGAGISRRTEDGLHQLALSDAEGKFTLEAIPSPASLVITAPGYISFTTQVTVEAASVLTATLEPFIVKGVYVSFGVLYLRDRLLEIIDLVDRTELNAIVVDVKSDRGRIAHQSQLEIAREGKAYHPDMFDLQELTALCKKKGIYAIARLVVFKDPVLAAVRPEYAIRRRNGSLYVDREGLTWGDPFKQEVRDYNIGLAREVAALGFNEIQFDYIRFPSDGVIGDIQYEVTNTVETRTAAIAEFLAQAYRALKPMGVMVSADLFGLVPWTKGGLDMGIGQRLEDIAAHVDYVSPMLYPATFKGVDLGFGEPMLNPYETVYLSCLRVQERTKTKLRPWLQHYWEGLDYYLAQKRAAEEAKTYGWMFWNPGGKYIQTGLFEPAQ